MIPLKMILNSGQANKTKLRKRFRNVAATTIIHRKWLRDVTERKLTMNAKKKVSPSVRTQHKLNVLTNIDKAIIRNIPILRTIPERQQLVKLIAGLPIFTRFPPKVRARLSTVIYFVYLTQGRRLIRQGHNAVTMYFVLTGEIAVTNNEFDSLTNTIEEKLNYIAGPGDWIGEVELLEECPRRYNYITISEVELLAVDLDEFNTVLKPVMSQLWQDKKAALDNLGYFDHFSKDQMISACHLAILRQFDPLETIYYEDKGQATYVHFVVSGECMILQCLKMKVIPKGKSKSFELVNIDHDKNIFPELSTQEIMEHLRDEELAAVKSSIMINQLSDDEAESEKIKKKRESRKVDLKAIEIKCGLRQPSNERISEAPSSGSLALRSSKLHRTSAKHSQVNYKPSGTALTPEHSRDGFSAHTIEYESTPTDSYYSEESWENEDFYDNWSGTDMSTNSSEYLLSTKKVHSHRKSHVKIENHFIDVGSIITGGIFGLGEKIEHRVIMARTSVQCLLLPRFWLTAKAQNAGNVWQQRRIRLDFTIPSRQSLFNDFLNTRSWQVFKQNIVDRETNVWGGNPTKIQDIPIIGRIVEHDDFA